MMKKLKALTAFLAATLVLVPLLSCQNTVDETESTTSKADTQTTGEASDTTEGSDTTEPAGDDVNPHLENLENADITIVYWYNPDQYALDKSRNSSVYDPILEAIPRYEEETGGKVTVEATDWNGMQQRVIDLVNAGEAPDLMEVYDRTMHPAIFSGLVTPIDEYVVDADFDFYKVSRELFSWEGASYAIPLKPYNFLMLYNKDMITLAGLEDPLEVFKRGEWTFDKFAEYGEALYKNVNGTVTQYGFSSWQDCITSFMLANGGALIDVDTVNGTATSGFENPAVVNTLEIIAPWFNATNGWAISPTDDSFFDLWSSNQLGFIRGPDLPQDEVPFEVGAVPYPSGPDGQEKGFVVYPQGMSVPTGSKNPKGAVAFMYTVNQVQLETGDEIERNRIGAELFDIIYHEDVTPVYAYDKSPTDIDQVIGSIHNLMNESMPPATIISTLKPELDAMVQRTYE